MELKDLSDELGILTPEQMEKAKQCRTPEELFALAKEEGVELTTDQLEAIAGGGIIDWDCPLDCLIDMGAPKTHDYRTKNKRS